MSKIVITINNDGSAFEDNLFEYEVILGGVAEKLADVKRSDVTSFKLLDTYGNSCGVVEILDD